jgi:hypothetical protein
MARAGINQRDGCAVAMADQDRPLDAQLAQELRQGFQRVPVHEVDAMRLLQHVRLSMAITSIDDRGQTRAGDDTGGKIAPLADRTQALVQEHQGRTAGGGGNAPVFEAAAPNVDEGGWT